ncbi:MAG TPA: hypothetical protein VES97_06610, partial [Solirubrobacteraceae bacterium]|nr:hypothetical protein [Solirubrobacteraceae bacterium]
EALAADAANLDIKQVAGHAPWRRLRVGEHRVLYRESTDEADSRYLVARVIDRRDLGGFSWSSQRLDRGGVDGQAGGVDGGVDG